MEARGATSGGAPARLRRRRRSALPAAVCVLLLASAVSTSAAAIEGAGRARLGEPEADDENSLLQIALQFLNRNLPDRDRNVVTDADLLRAAVAAVRARRASAWARAVPLPVFFNWVLPYRHLDEPFESQDWRAAFFEALAPLVAGAKSTSEAAQIVNTKVWALFHDPPIRFRPDQTPEIMSPGQVAATGFASCTGLSIFLAAACRAVGVPARVAGTPSWVTRSEGEGGGGGGGSSGGSSDSSGSRDGGNRGGGSRGGGGGGSSGSSEGGGGNRSGSSSSGGSEEGGNGGSGGGGAPNRGRFNNHNWVEVWDGGAWSFTGALEPDPRGLNRTWFFPEPAKGAIPGSPRHGIFAAAFAAAPGGGYFPLAWAPEDRGVPGLDVTEVYLGAEVPGE